MFNKQLEFIQFLSIMFFRKPSKEVLGQYSKKVELLKGILEAEKQVFVIELQLILGK